ncbi:MAG: DUF1566 domain-containing protein [Thermodesulfobacteriota bacterium]
MTKVFWVTYPKPFLIAFLLFAATLCLGVSSVQAVKPENPGGSSQLGTVLQKLDAVSCAASGFIDNLDGTVCDCVRNLMWEKKTGPVGDAVDCDSDAGCPDPHDVNNTYTWSIVGGPPDGTVYTVFLAQLNDVAGGGVDCFAGHCDWRLPQVGQDGGVPELESIVDLGKGNCGDLVGPCINPIFGPTATSNYWSSITVGADPLDAWVVDFNNGAVSGFDKDSNFHARAVRPCE